jgi:hypothetical protein
LNGSPTTGTIVSTALFDKPSSPRFRIASVIRSKHFLSGQCIDSRAELNTDTRFKEGHALEGQREGYTYYRRFVESVDKGEMIFPCQKVREVYLVSLRF